MRIRYAIAAASAGAALTFGGLTVPAQAAPGDCARGNFCMWTGYNQTGNIYPFSYHKDTLPSGISNNDRSSYNAMTSAGMEMWSDPGGRGTLLGCSRPRADWNYHSPERDVESLRKVSATC